MQNILEIARNIRRKMNAYEGCWELDSLNKIIEQNGNCVVHTIKNEKQCNDCYYDGAYTTHNGHVFNCFIITDIYRDIQSCNDAKVKEWAENKKAKLFGR